MNKGDIVEILVDYPPGLAEVVTRDEEEQFMMRGRTGVVVDVRGSSYRVKVDGFGVGHRGWLFKRSELRTLIPDYRR